jgi:hypothetical protein
LQNEKAGWCRPTWASVWRSCPDHSPNINQYQIYQPESASFPTTSYTFQNALKQLISFQMWQANGQVVFGVSTAGDIEHATGVLHVWLPNTAHRYSPESSITGLLLEVIGCWCLLCISICAHIHIQYIYIYTKWLCVYLSIVVVCQIKICSWKCVRHSSAMLSWELRAATKDWWCVGGHPLQWEGRPDPHVADLMGLPRP